MRIHHLYLGLMTLIVVGNLVLGAYIWRNRHIPSAKSILWIMATVIQINVMFFILTITPSAEVAYFTARARFLGLGFLNVFLITWTLQYTQQGGRLTPRRIALLCVIPTLMQIWLWLIPNGHTEFFKEWALIRSPDGYNVEHRLLAGFHDIHSIYTIFTTIFCTVLLINYALRVDSSKRIGLAWVIAGTMAAAAAGFFPVVIGEPPGLRLLPITMGLLSLAIGWAVVRHDAYMTLPVAYDLIYASMTDAVLLLDMRQRIRRVNPAAERVLGLPRFKVMQRPLSKIMPQASDPALFTDSLIRFEASGTDGAVYLGKCQPMVLGGKPSGWLMVLHDVTAQRRAEAELSSSEQRTQALLESLPDMIAQHHATAHEAVALEAERLKVMTEFIRTSMDHLRPPVQRIDAAAQSLFRSRDRQQRMTDIAQIDTDIDGLSGMVNSLLHTVTPIPADSDKTPDL